MRSLQDGGVPHRNWVPIIKEKKMKNTSQNIIIVLYAAIGLSVLYFLVTWFGHNVPKYNYTAGQIAQSSIRTPIAFNVMKTERMIDAEVTLAMLNYPSIYIVSEEINFNIQKNINDFFINFNHLALTNDIVFLNNFLNFNNLYFEASTIDYFLNTNNRNRIYNILTEQFASIIHFPIMEDEDRGRILRITDPTRASENLINESITITEARARILRRVTNATQRQIVSRFVDVYLESNLILDIDAQNAEKESLRRTIDPVITRVESNEYIILKNDRLTDHDILKLDSFRQEMRERQNLDNKNMMFVSTFGQFLYTFLILILLYYTSVIFYGDRFMLKKYVVLIYSTLFGTILLSVILYHTFDIRNIILFPIPMFILLMALLNKPRYGIMFTLFIMLIIGQFLHWDMLPIGNIIIGTILCLIVLQATKQNNYLMIFLCLLGSLMLTTLLTSLFRYEGLTELSLNLLYSMFNAIASVVGAYLIVPKLEKALEQTTKATLLELMDYNNPLLKQLSKDAQGTYNHALIVGNIAEQCAEAISANSMIARVGSYYHDIGKLLNPSFFIENVIGENPHNKLNPIESAKIIKQHVKDGLVLARKHKIPYQIIDIIQQHHGDGKIKFFLHRANELGIDYEPEDFQYGGPKPRSKEAVIVMIADIVESTMKSYKEPNDELIKKIVDDSVNNLIAEEQFLDAPITMRELTTVKNTMLPILASIHRKRVEYPK